MQKQVQTLEVSLRDMLEKCSQLENGKMELEKQLMGLQGELEEERRVRNLGTETITDLQGESWFKRKHTHLLEVNNKKRKTLLGHSAGYQTDLQVLIQSYSSKHHRSRKKELYNLELEAGHSIGCDQFLDQALGNF